MKKTRVDEDKQTVWIGRTKYWFYEGDDPDEDDDVTWFRYSKKFVETEEGDEKIPIANLPPDCDLDAEGFNPVEVRVRNAKLIRRLNRLWASRKRRKSVV